MIIDRYIPIWGGAENQLRQLIPHLKSHECEITILTRRWERALLVNELIDETQVFRVGISGKHLVATIFYLLGLLKYVYINRRNIDVIHTHGAAALGAVGRVLGILSGKPNIAKIATAGRIPALQNQIFGKFILYFLKRSKAIVCISDEIRKELEQIKVAESKIIFAPNAVDGVRFSPLEKKENLRKRHHFNMEDLIVIFSGRLVYRKGLDILIDVWSGIIKQCPNAYLIILGSGKGQLDSIEEKVMLRVKQEKIRNIFFKGEVMNPEQYYRMADILAFPSRKEGFPNVLLEGMASGLVPVAFNIGGVVELIRDKENGFIVSLENTKEFQKCLMELIQNKEMLYEFSKLARERISYKYTFESLSLQYLKVYKKLTSMNLFN